MPSSKKKIDVGLCHLNNFGFCLWSTTYLDCKTCSTKQQFRDFWCEMRGFPDDKTTKNHVELVWHDHYTIELHNLCFLVQCMQYCLTFFFLIHNSSGLSRSTERHGRQSRQECSCGAGFGGDLDDLFQIRYLDKPSISSNGDLQSSTCHWDSGDRDGEKKCLWTGSELWNAGLLGFRKDRRGHWTSETSETFDVDHVEGGGFAGGVSPVPVVTRDGPWVLGQCSPWFLWSHSNGFVWK